MAKKAGILAIIITLLILSITQTLSQSQQNKAIYLSVEKPSYEMGEGITLILTPPNLAEYDLIISSGTTVYKYGGELKNNIEFYPAEKGIYSVELRGKLSQAIIDSLTFTVGVDATETAQTNTTIEENESIREEQTNNLSTNISAGSETSTPEKLISTDKDSYTINEDVKAFFNINNLADYKIYYEYNDFSQRYFGESKEITFTPRGTGTHSLIIFDSNGNELERHSFEVVEATNQEKESTGQGTTIPSIATIVESLEPETTPENNVCNGNDLNVNNGSITPTTLTPPTSVENQTNLQDSQISLQDSNMKDSIIKVRNSKGGIDKITIKTYDENHREITGNTNTTINATENAGTSIAEFTEITPENKMFKKLVLRKLEIGSLQNIENNPTLGLDEVPQNKVKVGRKNILKAFAVDASGLNFTNGTLTGTAKGTELWKCKAWNFQTQTCLGTWQKIMDLTPGQEYDILITPDDPGYAETGLATVNTKKPIYYPGENAELIIVVLDNEGYLVSNAIVSLDIIKPDNSTTTLSTTNSTISETDKGIYQATYSDTSQEGNYSLTVRANADDVNSTLYSYFFVKAYYEFDIIRNTPVTTDPWLEQINSSITITSHINATINASLFNFTEVLPETFEIINNGGATITTINNKTYLTWTDLDNNSVVSYTTRPPLITPELYEFGPSFVSYGSNVSNIFYEARPWFLAVDPTATSSDLESGTITYQGGGTQTQFFYENASSIRATYWNNTNDGDWASSTSNACNGTSFRDAAGGASNLLSKPAGINTTGYGGITFKFTPSTNALDGSEYLRVYWYNGSSWTTVLDWTNTDAACSSPQQSFDLGSSADNNANFMMRFVCNHNGGSNERCIVDDIRLLGTAIEADVNKTFTNYSNVSVNVTSPLTNITIIIYVSSYDNSGSAAAGNNAADLDLTLYNGSAWVNIGKLNITGTGNFSISTTDATILAAWATQSNRNFSVRGIYMDYKNSTAYDQIDYTGVWAQIQYPVPPTVNINSSLNNSFTSNTQPNIYFNFTDSDSATANCTLYVGNTAYGNNATTLNNTRTNITATSALSQGNYNVYVNCTGNATGLAGKSSTINITIDTTAPTVNAIRPADNNLTANNRPNFFFNYTDSLSQNASCTLYIGTSSMGSNSTVINNTQTNITASSTVSDGSYYWNVTCTDRAGNIAGSAARNITIDSTGPAVTISQPENGTNVSTDIYIVNATVTDQTEVHTTTFLYRQNTTDTWHYACSDDRGPVYECEWNTTTLTDATTYQIRAYANDTLGNIGANDTRYNISLDRTGPVTIIDNPDNGTSISMNTYLMNATVTDQTEVHTTTFLYRQNTTDTWHYACSDDRGPVYECEWNTTTLTDATTYQIRAYANDTLGNIGANDTRYNITITHMPLINSVECFKTGTGWSNCTGIIFGSTLEQVRADCTPGGVGAINNVSFMFTNIEDNNIYFNETTFDNSTGYWVYNNTDLTIYDSGNFNLKVICRQNPQVEENINWTIPWGNLSIRLITPNSSTNVTQNQFFNFTVNVNCTGGECGYVNATLDPTINWWNSSWQLRKAVSITNIGSTELADFPAYLNVSKESDMQANFSDLRFINGSCNSGDSTQLDYEIENYTETNAHIWIRIPTLSTGINSICMYYNNPDASSRQNSSAVWDSDYQGVWHMQRVNATDSTSNMNNGTGRGVAINSSGYVDGALNFSGSSTSYVNCSNQASLHSNSQITVEGWAFAIATKNNYAKIASKPYTANSAPYTEYGLTLDGSANKYGFELTTGGTQTMLISSTSSSTGEWHYVVGVYNGSNMKIYIDGILENTTSKTGTINDYNRPLILGSNGVNLAQAWKGLLDEIRFSNVSRTADWINQSYQIVANQNSIVSFEAEETQSKGTVSTVVGATPFYTINANPMLPANDSCLANMTASRNCNITWQVNATGTVGSNWTFYAYTQSMNYSANVTTATTESINLTIIGNMAPVVSSITIMPAYPVNADDLNCTFTVSDANLADTLTANVTWYNNNTVYNSEIISVSNGVQAGATLGSGNTTTGDVWHCGATPNDGWVGGLQVNSSSVTVLASHAPTVSQIQCRRNMATWGACSGVTYRTNLTAVRANCSDVDGYPVNVTFQLVNNEDAKTFFLNTTTDNSTGYFIFDNDNIWMNDSGTFNLTVSCIDDSGITSYGFSNWTIPWGTLSVTLINPNTSTNVTQNRFFNFTVNVNCTGGECGYVNATLDPVNWWNTSWNYRRTINLSEKAGKNLTSYQFNITLDTQALIAAGKMSNGCADIRFVTNTSAVLDHWVESGCNTTNTLIWAKYNLSANTNATIYMYYGNSGAANISNASSTMFIYEDMSQAPSGSLTGDAVYLNSTWGVRLTDTSTYLLGYIYYTRNPGSGFYGYYETWAGGGDGGGGSGADATWIGVHENSASATREDMVDGGYHFTVDEWGTDDTDPGRIAFTKSTTDNGAAISQWNSTTIADSNWHSLEVYFYNNGTRANSVIYYNGTLRVNGTDTSSQAITGNYFTIAGRTGGSTNNHYVRNIKIRRYVNPQPTVTLDSELSQMKGAISMNTSATPFYTITANPTLPENNSCLSNFGSGSSCNLTWQVNATGTAGIPWEFFVIVSSLNYSSAAYVPAIDSTHINITIISNIAPNVTSISILPTYPLATDPINCTFTVYDTGYFDTLTANVSWYRNNILNTSTIVSVSNGVSTVSSLGSGNLTLGSTWHCGVTPYDQITYGSQRNSTNVTVVNTRPPVINLLQCLVNNSVWMSCANLTFLSNFSGVMVNCTSDATNPVSNVTFNMSNMPDNKLFFNNRTTVHTGDLWYYYQNITINDSGNFTINAICMDNLSITDTEIYNWSVPWGRLVASLVSPSTNGDVAQNNFFNFTAQISCVGGECGNVNATLDPKPSETSENSYTPISREDSQSISEGFFRSEGFFSKESVNKFPEAKKKYQFIDGTKSGNPEYPDGIVTITSKKPVYEPGEKAELMIVVLNKKGDFTDDTDLTLKIIMPKPNEKEGNENNNKEELFTKQDIFTKQDMLNPFPGMYTLKYSVPNHEGTYLLELTADGGVSDHAESLFESRTLINTPEFEIIREAPLAINPWPNNNDVSDVHDTNGIDDADGKAEFTSKITITRNSDKSSGWYTNGLDANGLDASGLDEFDESFTFTEIIPAEFEIIDDGGADVWELDNEKRLVWSGLFNNAAVSYSVAAPKIAPAKYALQSFITAKQSPITAKEGNSAHSSTQSYFNYYEARPWMIAADPTNYYSASSNSTAYYSSGTATLASGGDYTDTIVADCSAGTCTQSNSWVTGLINFDTAGQSCKLNSTLTFNVSNIRPSYLDNVTIRWNGCWHGDDVYGTSRCENGDNPEFSSGTGGGTFEMWIYKNGTYEQMDCINTVGSECGASNEINLGTTAVAPAWGNADAYHNFTFRKTNLDSNYANNSLILIRWVVWGASVCGSSDDDDIVQVIDYANLTANWNYPVKSGAVSMVTGTEPFYTITQNPMAPANDSCLGNMIAGQSCNITWQVNATGGINTTHEFYVLFNLTNYSSYLSDNSTAHINLTIRNSTGVPPVVTLVSPADNNATNSTSVTFNCSATDNRGLVNMTLYANFTGSFLENGTNSISGTSNSTTFTRTLPEGKYIWNCMAYDNDGNIDWGNSNRTVTVDMTMPNITLIAPSPAESFTASTIWFNFTAYDNLDSLLNCNLTVNGTVRSSNFTAQNGNITRKNVSGLSQGTYFWNVTCWDDARNTNISETWNFTISDLSPNVTLITPDNYSQSSANIDLEYFPADNNGIALATLYINGEINDTEAVVLNNDYNIFSVLDLAEGRYNWTVNVTDDSGLSAQAAVRWFTIDSTAPNITLNYPDPSFNTNLSNTTINFTVTDNLDANLNCSVTVNGATTVPNFLANNGTPKQVNLSNLADGLNYWNVTCWDDVGNTNTSETRLINVSAPPTISLNWPAQNYSQNTTNIRLNYTPADNSGLVNCTLILNGAANQTNSTINNTRPNYFNLTSLADGNYNWTINCTDTSGLIGTASSERTFSIDTQKPNISLNSPGPGAGIFGRNVVFNYTAYDNLDSYLSCNLTIDGVNNRSNISSPNSEWVNVTVNISVNGIHYWNVTCWDNANNTNTSTTRNFTMQVPPGVIINSPDNNSVFNYTYITLNYTPTDSGTIVNSSLILNGAIVNTTANPGNGVPNYFYYNFTNEGIYNWSINASNNNNLTGASETRRIIVDTHAPNVTIISPTNSQTVSANNVTFSFNISDNVADYIVCNITVSGVQEWTGINASNHSTITRYKLMPDGSYNWSVTCIDWANNTNIYSLINFTVDAPPNITLNWPTINYRTTNNNITFNYTPSDPYGIENCSLYIDGLLADNDTSINVNAANYFNQTNIAEGRHNWTVDCVDALPDANHANGTVRNFTIDTAAPNITLIAPSEGNFLNNNNVTFNWTAIDYPDINISCNFTVDGLLNQSNITKVSGSYFNVTLINISDGAHNWSVTCWDDLNNTRTSDTGNFTINQPDLVLDASRIIFNNTNPDLYQTITIRANVSNTGGVSATGVLVEFWDNGERGVGIAIGDQTSTVPVNNSVFFNVSWEITPGYHVIYVYADPDNAIPELNETNNNATANISVLFSNITFPENNTLTSDNTTQLDFNMTDYTSNNITYKIYVDGTYNSQTGNSVSGTVTSINLSALSDGNHQIKVQANDTIGRSKNSSILNITIDTRAPNSTFITANNTFFNNSSPTIQIRIIDSIDSNINYTMFVNGSANATGNATNNTIVNITINGMTNGSYILIIQAFDDAGNYANSSSITIYIDSIPPNITLNSPIPSVNLTNTTVLLNFTVTDNLDSMLNCNLTLDANMVEQSNVSSGSWHNYTTSSQTEGTHYWNVTCWDNANNTNTSETRSFNIFIAPRVNLTRPINNNVSNSPNQTFYFNISDDTGFNNCSLWINGIENTTKPGSGLMNHAENNFTLTGMNDGAYNWSVKCYDNTTMYLSGQSETWNITIDLYTPTPSIITANYSWFNSSSPNISFIITDNHDGIINYTLFVDGNSNAFGAANNNSNSSDLLESIANNGTYTIILQATDDAGNSANSSSVIIYVDTVMPNINLSWPENGGEINNNTVRFNFTVTDNMANYTMCNLTISNGVYEYNINASNGTMQNVTKAGFTSGIYYWNVSCIDLARNRKTSATWNFTILAPDFVINAGNISFNESYPEEGDNITMFANIWNTGGTPGINVTVQFWLGDPDDNGTQINSNRTIATLNNNANYTVNITFTTVIGYNNIFIVVDPPTGTGGRIAEENENNNKANTSFTVSLYQTYAGNTTDLIEMEKQSINKSIFTWNVDDVTGSNLFVADLEANVNFNSLQAIGRNTSNFSTTNDFTEIDTKLGSTNYTDSVNNTYTASGSPKATRDFNIYLRAIASVPVVNSTNVSAFVTGMLWDTSDGNTEYNGTQDLIFITELNQSQQGSQGIYDFEIKVPALLRNYNSAGTTVAFYTEIK